MIGLMTDTTPTARRARSVNAAEWSRRLGHDQAQRRDGVSAILSIGGQRPVDAEGRLMHEGDAIAQVALALDNLTAVVVAGGMTLADLAHLRIHATSRAALLDAQFVVREHLVEHAVTTPITAVEVCGLADPGMEVEIDGLAVRTENRTEGTQT
jgi:enamine deaminase RidA (YjgF/YER057c/UK114 family)